MKSSILFLLVAICFFGAPPLLAAKDLPKIAVWDLSAGDVKVAYAQDLTFILVSEISKLGKYEVYSQENVRTLAGWTAERMRLGCTDTKCLTALGQMDIAKLISGRVGRIGNTYLISLHLFDTQKVRAENSISEECKSEDELIPLVRQTARKLLGVEVAPSRVEEKTPEKVTTAAALPELGRTFEFKISVDTMPNHPRNMGLEIFIEQLTRKSGGRLVPKLYHSAQLYKDAHVTKALKMGTVEMAVPGNWILEGFDTNMSLTMLPMFFGQPGRVTEELVDGKFGEAVSKSLEKKVGAKALGRWYELGFDQCFTRARKITKVEDFKGLKMRHSGGSIPEERFKALGASPIFIAWPDVPMALFQGVVDGLATTCKSAESGKLYEAGIKYGAFTRNFCGFYIPMMSLKFWDSLPPDLQNTILDVWKEHVPKQREIARREQKEAKEIMESKGVEIYEPSDEELAKWRKHIMPIQDKLVKDLKHDPELVKLAIKALGM